MSLVAPLINMLHMTDVKIHLCILAAGASRRFGSVKQLQMINGLPMVMHAYNFIEHSSIVDKHLVLGAHVDSISTVIPSSVNVVISKNWSLGLSASIASSVDAISHNATHLMLALADQVAIEAKDYNALIDKANQHPDSVISSKYAGKRGVPAIFPRRVMPTLKQLNGDRGASIFLNTTEDVIDVEITEAEIDIDTPTDLTRLKSGSLAI